MANVEMRNEILFKAPTRVGLLADVTEALRDAGVNILSIGAYDKGGQGEFLMVTDNNKLAFAALEKLGGSVDLMPVVAAEVPNLPGELALISRRLADHNVNVSQVYATSVDAPTVMIIITAPCEVDIIKMLSDL
jgi:hypothetical protein